MNSVFRYSLRLFIRLIDKGNNISIWLNLIFNKNISSISGKIFR